jgi:hypothetical protein
MDKFKLNCITEVKTHDENLAAKLMRHWRDETECDFGRVISHERITVAACTLWTFKFVGNK